MKRLLLVPLLLLGCQSQNIQENSTVQFALGVMRGLGDGVLRAKGYAELKRGAAPLPQLADLIDTAPKDESISLLEVENFLRSAAANPESTALLISTLLILQK